MLRILDTLIRFILTILRRIFGHSTPNAVPRIRYISPIVSVNDHVVPILYELSDVESDPANVTVTFNITGGPSRIASSVPSDPRHSGTTGLLTSPQGRQYQFIWAWQQDINQNTVRDVVITLQVAGASGVGQPSLSGALTLSIPVTIPNQPPEVMLLSPSGDVTANEIVIEYLLRDAESDPADIQVMFSIAGAQPLTATPNSLDPRHSGVSAMASNPAGILHRFIWNWQQDIPYSPVNDVVVSLLPTDAHGSGQFVSSIPFTITALSGSPPIPKMEILSPSGGSVPAPVRIDYVITDALSRIFSVSVRYSLDQGISFLQATADNNSQATTGLSSSPVGTPHSFLWDSLSDLNTASASDVIILLEATDGSTSMQDTSPAFDINVNHPPLVDIWLPNGGLTTPPVRIDYVLGDFDSDPLNVIPEFKLTGGTFQLATMHPTSMGTQNLPSAPHGRNYYFMWDANADLPGPLTSDVVFRIRVSDGITERSDETPPFDVGTPLPSVVINFPKGGTHGVPVGILYTLSDPIELVLRAEIMYSIDLGQSFHPATAALGAGSEDLTALAASPSGVDHFFAWNAQADLAVIPEDDIIIKIKVYNPIGAVEANSILFHITNRIPGAPPLPPLPPGSSVPVIGELFTKGNYSQAQIPLRFTLKDAEMKRTSVLVEYNDGSGFKPATPSPMSDTMIGLAAPDITFDHRFIWDALTDVGITLTAKPVTIQMTPYAGPLKGSPVTEIINVKVEPVPPVPAPEAITPMNNLRFVILEGNDQYGAGGFLMPSSLKLKVEGPDENGVVVPWPGITVSFKVVNPAGMHFRLEEDDLYGTTSANDGIVAIKVRTPDVSSPIAFQVMASVVGVPSVTATFNLTAGKATIEALLQNPAELDLNLPSTISFFLDADQDITTTDHILVEKEQPLHYRVRATNAMINNSQPKMPELDYGLYITAGTVVSSVRVVPISAVSNVELLIDVPSRPSILPKTISIAVRQRANATKRIAYNTSGTTTALFEDMFLRFEFIDDNDAIVTTVPKAYPGLTLFTPFRVRIRDQRNEDYKFQSQTAAGHQCNISPAREELDILWSGSNLKFSTSSNGPSSFSLSAKISERVYVTPVGPGPWMIEVGCRPLPGRFLDPHPNSWSGVTSSGDPWCYKAHALDASPTGLRISVQATFPVERATMALLDVTTNQPAPLLKPAMRVQIAVSDLSAFISPPVPLPVQMRLEVTIAASPHMPTGQKGKWNESYDLHTHSPSELRSETIWLVQGDSFVPSTVNDKLHVIVPRAALVGRSNSLSFSVPVAGKVRSRSVVNHSELMQEAPTGSSISEGVQNTVMVHSGEFMQSYCDLQFSSRQGNISVCRTYRSQVVSNTPEYEPLGPGWFLDADSFLTAGKPMNWWQMGRSTELFISRAKGQFFVMSYRQVIDQDSSAYEIYPKEGGKIHFNTDGSLRFVENRLGEKVKYEYNEKGQLFKITDPLNPADRWITFEYWTDQSVPELMGRLIRVKDFGLREVNYDYYRNGDTKGGGGWLKSVTYPSCPTMRGGDQPIAFRRKETYEYEVDPGLGWRLRAILNSDDKITLINHYEDGGRILKQEPKRDDNDQRKIIFDYSTPNETTVTDLADIKTTYSFPVSPYWDGACARDTIADATGRRIITKTIYNHDGLLVDIETPVRDRSVFVYDHKHFNPRSRSNLLALIQKPRLATSTVRVHDRITLFAYESLFNQIAEMVPPEGSHPASDRALFIEKYTYDSSGNHVQTTHPRSLNAYRKTDGGVRWIEESPTIKKSYNPTFKRLTSVQDEMGVVTKYLYYPVSDPGGMNGSAPSEDGGGFLAKIIVDAEDNADRIKRFGDNVAIEPRTTQYFYNTFGDLIKEIHHQGTPLEKVITYERNAQHEINKKTVAQGTPLEVVSNIYYDADGNLAMSELEQDGAGNLAGGDKLREMWMYNRQGHLMEHRVKVWDSINFQFKWIHSTVAYHDSDQVHYVEPTYHQQLPDSKQVHTWNDQGLLETLTTGDQKVEYQYTDNGDLRQETYPSDTKTTYHQDVFNEVKAVVDERGNVLESEKDAAGRVVRTVVQHGHTTNPNRDYPTTSPAVHLQETKYDENGNARRQHTALTILPSSIFTLPAGGTSIGPVTDFIAHDLPLPPSIISYQDEGKVSSGDGFVTEDTLYNAWGLVTRETNDEAGYVWYRHNTHKQEVEVQSYTGNVYKSEFDEAGNVTRIYEKTVYRSGGSVITNEFSQKMDYDLLGRIRRIIDHKGNAMYSEYDQTGFVKKTWDAMGIDSAETFNGYAVNEKGNLTEFKRDALGRVVKIEKSITDNGLGSGSAFITPFNRDAKTIRNYEYSPDGGPLLAFVDQGGYRIENEYSSDGQVTKVHRWTSPGTGGIRHTTEKKYKVNTSLIDRTIDSNGSVLKFHYEQDFLIKVEGILPASIPANARLEGATTYETGYNGDGSVELVIDTVSGYQTASERDTKGRVIRETQGNYTVRTTFIGDRECQLKYHGLIDSVNYFLDRQGRLERIEKSGQVIAQFLFNGDGRLHRRKHGVIEITFTPDDSGKPQDMTVQLPSSIIAFHLDRDRLGRIRKMTRTFNGIIQETTWTYDSAGRIVKESYVPTTGSSSLETICHYDGDDVLRKLERDVKQGTSIIRQVTEQQRGYMGQITFRNNVALLYDNNGNLTDDGTRQYIYDPWNRLLRVETNGQTLCTYEYDGQNRLIRCTTSADTEEYVYNDWQLIQVQDGNGNSKERYIYSDQTDDLIYIEKNNVTYSVVIGPTGNVDSVLSQNGQLIESYVYGLHGDVTVLDPNGQLKTTPPVIRILFMCRPYDFEARLYQYRMRWYDPATGCFLTPDPQSYIQGPNHYILAKGDPVNKTDSLGMEEEESVVGAWVSGFFEGLGIGAKALVNEGAKAASFGFYEKDLLAVAPEDQRIYNYAKIPARIGTEAAFAAATLGVGTAVKGLQAGGQAIANAPRAVRYVAVAIDGSQRIARGIRALNHSLRAGEIAQAGTSFYKGYRDVRAGKAMGWVGMAAGGLGLPIGTMLKGAATGTASAVAGTIALVAQRGRKLNEAVKIARKEADEGANYVYRLVDFDGVTTRYFGITNTTDIRALEHALIELGGGKPFRYLEIMTGAIPSRRVTEVLEAGLLRRQLLYNPALVLLKSIKDRLARAGLYNKNLGLSPEHWGGAPRFDLILPPSARTRLRHPDWSS